ncbi:MAG TPA: hypothetical protein DIS63_03685 [Lactobacillus sp.]|nr:hypothetical protein [Lactobacillus sp.]
MCILMTPSRKSRDFSQWWLTGTMEYNRRMEQGRDTNHRYYGKKPSYFTISADKLDKIVKENINLSKLSDRYQFLDVGEAIGICIVNGKELETTRMRVALSKKGYHAIPAVPSSMRNDENR